MGGVNPKTSRISRNRLLAYIVFAACFGLSFFWPLSGSSDSAVVDPQQEESISPSLTASPSNGLTSRGRVPAVSSNIVGTHDSNNHDQCTWRSDFLAGSCVGWDRVNSRSHKTADACQEACCKLPLEGQQSCVAWQFRSDVGCFLGGDVRLGMEKDGPAAWCVLPPICMFYRI